MVMYRCLHCPADKPWANRKRDNAWHHARRCHADIISSLDRTLIGGSSDVLDDEREAKRPRIDAFLVLSSSLQELYVVYLDINLAKVAMWLYGYLPGYIDIQIISPTYLDIDISR
jgi:hypothetical protein